MKQLLLGVARGAYRRLIPARAKNTLRVRLMFDERDKPAVNIEEFDGRPVVVIAPHPDDEVIGCGGAVRRHVLAGATVTPLILTDGRRGDAALYRRSDLGAAEVAATEAALIEVRKRESRNAAEVLGTAEPRFFDVPDGQLEGSEDLAQRLGTTLVELQPRVVYVPSVLDTHLDHWGANLVFEGALRWIEGAGKSSDRNRGLPEDLILREYEVWAPLLVNALVDISEVLENKLDALRAFESQLPYLDLPEICSGLHRYRSIHRGAGRGYAEAFFQSSPQAYRYLFRRLRER